MFVRNPPWRLGSKAIEAATDFVATDYLVVMDAGRVIASGEFDEVKQSRIARVRVILTQLIGDIASYDTDLLELLDGDNKDGP